jgi:PAS domain S-box-containing protein
MKIFIDVLFNLGTIIAFGIIPSFISISSKYKKFYYGLLFGLGSMIGMLNPVILKPGLFFDGRSVLISLAGLFFGPIPAIMSASIAIIYRFYQAGMAATTGSLVILSSMIIGIVFFRFRNKDKDDLPVRYLFLFGILVHLAMILLMFTLPSGNALSTIKTISLPVMIIYPLATVVVGKILSLSITRNNIMKTLHETESIFNTFMEHSPIYVFFKDENIRSLRLSKNYVSLLGKPLQDLLGKNMDELFPSDFAKSMINDDKRVLQEGRVITVDEELNGRFYTTIKFPILAEGEPRFLAGYTIDITERKMMEENLIKSHLLLQRIIDLLPIRVFWKDVDLHFLGCNQIFANDAGKNKAEELIGLDDFQMNWKEQAKAYQEDDQIVMKSGISKLNFEESQTTPTGNIMWVKTSKVPLTDLNGITIGILGVYEDITDRKKAEEDLHKLNEELESRVKQRTRELENSNKDLEAFSNSISHDLRAPLRAIEGFSQILESEFKTKLGPEGLRLINIIIDNTNHMNRLIRGMLSVSKASNGDLKKIYLEMNTLVNGVYQEIVSEEERKKITLNVSPMQPGYGDAILIKQVWINLLENAVKFTRNKENPTITIQSTVKDNQIVYSIKDNGTGFDPDYKPKLFQMFQRLHTPEEFEGTGIGLAVVERIIRRHSGKVWAEGEEGVGATFYFTLPLVSS